MEALITKIVGGELGKYITARHCYFNNSSMIIQPKFGVVTFDFTSFGASRCIVRMCRKSGNGLLFASSGHLQKEVQVLSQSSEEVSFNLYDGRLRIHRTARSMGELCVFDVSLYGEREEVNWNEVLKSVEEYSCLRVLDGNLVASDGSFIRGDGISVTTTPDGMFVQDGNKITFKGSCVVNGINVSGVSFTKPVFNAPQHIKIDLPVQTIEPVVAQASVPAYAVNAPFRAVLRDLVNRVNQQPQQPFDINVLPETQSVFNSFVSEAWNLIKVPKVIHFYWGAPKLTFLRYVSMYSFIKHNPDWKVKLHVPQILGNMSRTWGTIEQAGASAAQNTGNDYLQEFLKFSAVELVKHDFSRYGFSNSANEVHKADFIRWYLLATEGGVWSDNDIVYILPMNLMVDNNLGNKDCDTFVCPYHPGSHAIGFLMGSANNAFWRQALNDTKYYFSANQYEGIGAKMINNRVGTYRQNAPNCKVLEMNPATVYSLPAIVPFLSNTTDMLQYNKAIGFHWYGGHPDISKIEASINPGNYRNHQEFLGKLVQYTLDRG